MYAALYRRLVAQIGRERGIGIDRTPKVAIALQEESYTLGIVLFGHESQTAQIHRTTLETLNDDQPAQSRPLG